MKIGIGFDVHALTAGKELILGGVNIPHKKGLAGHSDADVLTHAVCDALIGAAAEGNIGKWFPDTDPQYRNISSLSLLKEVGRRLKELGWQISNIDSTIIIDPTLILARTLIKLTAPEKLKPL